MNDYTQNDWMGYSEALRIISKNIEKIKGSIGGIEDYLSYLPDIVKLLSKLVNEIKNMRKPNRGKKEEKGG